MQQAVGSSAFATLDTNVIPIWYACHGIAALEEALARKGTLNKLRAELRAEVFKVVGGADVSCRAACSTCAMAS
jgi:hypothetical protein